jgi:hypothetical protein
MFVTIGGRLSDIFGRRYFFLAGACLLIVGSIVSATGQSINQMIAGGAIFGAGSGFLEMSFGAVQVEALPPRSTHVLTMQGNCSEQVPSRHHRRVRCLVDYCPADASHQLGNHQRNEELAHLLLRYDCVPNLQSGDALLLLPPTVLQGQTSRARQD